MSRADTGGGVRNTAAYTNRALWRAFPLPNLLMPHSAGVDISDSSIKWIALSRPEHGMRTVKAWGREPLEEGIVVSGIVRDVPRLASALAEVKKKMPHIHAVHAALPEETAFVYDMSVQANLSRTEILNRIEFELEGRVPIPPSAAVFDYDLIPAENPEEGQEIGVFVFPRDLAESYAEAFEGAGLTLLSLELEVRSIARAVTDPGSKNPVTLLVDFGLKRTGFAVLKYGIPIFTSTVDIGGEVISKALIEKLGIAPGDVEAWKNNEGLLPHDGPKSPGVEIVSGAASALGSEIAKHFHYWDTRRSDRGERLSPVSSVFIVGGSSNLRGIGDYIAGRVQAPVERPNVWRNVAPFDLSIPPIDRRTSLQFVTAVGLALRGF